ncbi:MAG: hypothetical protein WCA19_19800 [Candidatus Acidiferrales bacterium]
MRSPENDASAAVGGLGPREQPESAAIPARAKIDMNVRCDFAGNMGFSITARTEKMAAPLHLIPRPL